MTQPPGYAPAPEYREPVSRFNPATAVLAAIAAVLGVLALTAFSWYRDNYSSLAGHSARNTVKFSDIHDRLRGAPGTTISDPYFSWLGYVLLAASVVLAIACAFGARGALRTLTVLVALAGLVLTAWAIRLVDLRGYWDWAKHTSFGAWAMAGAFLLCLVAALVPARRQRSRGY